MSIRRLPLPLLLTACIALSACQRAAEDTTPPVETVEVASPEEGGAVSSAPVDVEAVPALPVAGPDTGAVDWSMVMTLPDATASVSCELDYANAGDGDALTAFDQDALRAAMAPCAERGVFRLRFKGRVTEDFTRLMRRLAVVADDLSINKRVLDIDSSGGMVEEAIRAGDVIAETRWTIWVREGAVCHSSCVFLLAGGDTRLIGGRVGIHRIIRMSSSASTRAELNRELRAVYGRVRDYLERNGAAVAVADLMMAVPNRSLRILTPDELKLYGLDGVNPAQDDLDRLRLMRKCGQDFVARRDAYARAFDTTCSAPDRDVEQMAACGLELRGKFGFPDAQCPTESPLSEFDLVGALTAAAGNASRLRILGVPDREPRPAARQAAPVRATPVAAPAAVSAESRAASAPADEGDAAPADEEAEAPVP
ncbi:conserved exported hypothetical protein [Luteimonas sp. 9C]|uniref:COG3904 family protein n=1 Tax=Luteimonas sp. 9C TaxID=2653148 RepID=UPI0012F33680|nr:hypothetical protein [Luteimonas sp. 9C]VXB44483.1 conserved exported hypothetical protein [Luteimonas sp. 9C]